MINEEEYFKILIEEEKLKEYEAEAAKLEVTLDYYLAEFI
jgi:hypothetical protein